jgi:hypothetical protein
VGRGTGPGTGAVRFEHGPVELHPVVHWTTRRSSTPHPLHTPRHWRNPWHVPFRTMLQFRGTVTLAKVSALVTLPELESIGQYPVTHCSHSYPSATGSTQRSKASYSCWQADTFRGGTGNDEDVPLLVWFPLKLVSGQE